MFPPHILLKQGHIQDRAELRGIDMSHAVLAGREGIEHQGAGGVLHHDAVIPNNPSTTIRVVTSMDRKKAITAYYLPTEKAVREREEKIKAVEALREQETAAKASEAASSHHAAVSRHHQRENQMIRGHNAGEHERKPSKKCPLC